MANNQFYGQQVCYVGFNLSSDCSRLHSLNSFWFYTAMGRSQHVGALAEAAVAVLRQDLGNYTIGDIAALRNALDSFVRAKHSSSRFRRKGHYHHVMVQLRHCLPDYHACCDVQAEPFKHPLFFLNAF